jgi:hypothetical protein
MTDYAHACVFVAHIAAEATPSDTYRVPVPVEYDLVTKVVDVLPVKRAPAHCTVASFMLWVCSRRAYYAHAMAVTIDAERGCVRVFDSDVLRTDESCLLMACQQVAHVLFPEHKFTRPLLQQAGKNPCSACSGHFGRCGGDMACL